jgi:DNA transformation protein
VNDSFLDYVRDQLAGLHEVSYRRMFGGHGLYRGPVFFGILSKGRLYFKTDAQSRAVYAERGMNAFKPSAKQTLRSYYEVPPEVLEDAELLCDWARRSLAAVVSRGTPRAKRRASRSTITRRNA